MSTTSSSASDATIAAKDDETFHGASMEAVQHHYDAGNEFYRLWLDPTLTYSSAMYPDDAGPDYSLEDAQHYKNEFFLQEVNGHQCSNLLEVGCGWGTFLERAANRYGIQNVVGLTLSAAQEEHARRLNNDQIEVRLESWTDHVPKVVYDGIVVIAAFEHFAKSGANSEQRLESYRMFFRKCHDWLKPGSILTMQTMAYGKMRTGDIPAHIYRDVFPESDMPRGEEIFIASDRLFEVRRLRNDREHYARTLKCWLKSLRANREAAIDLVGEEVVDRYDNYLRHSIMGFATAHQQLLRVTLQRLD